MANKSLKQSVKTILLFILYSSISNLCAAQKPVTDADIIVQGQVIKMFEALAKRDSTDFKKYCTEDFLILENGQIWNKDTLINRAIILKQGNEYLRVNSFDFIDTKVEKKVAWVSYHLKSDVVFNGKKTFSHWMETAILIRKKKQWVMKVLHSTLIERKSVP